MILLFALLVDICFLDKLLSALELLFVLWTTLFLEARTTGERFVDLTLLVLSVLFFVTLAGEIEVFFLVLLPTPLIRERFFDGEDLIKLDLDFLPVLLREDAEEELLSFFLVRVMRLLPALVPRP
jgi:hypothetical protein